MRSRLQSQQAGTEEAVGATDQTGATLPWLGLWVVSYLVCDSPAVTETLMAHSWFRAALCALVASIGLRADIVEPYAKLAEEAMNPGPHPLDSLGHGTSAGTAQGPCQATMPSSMLCRAATSQD